MNLYVVYKSPTDYPDTYVCRRWEIDFPDNKLFAMEVFMIDDDLDKIRTELRKKGLFKISRVEGDDEKIVETWV